MLLAAQFVNVTRSCGRSVCRFQPQSFRALLSDFARLRVATGCADLVDCFRYALADKAVNLCLKNRTASPRQWAGLLAAPCSTRRRLAMLGRADRYAKAPRPSSSRLAEGYFSC